MSTFKFMQAINTPYGPGHFIGYFRDGLECQITRWAKRDGKNICVNEVYLSSQITAREKAEKIKTPPANKIIVVDVATV